MIKKKYYCIKTHNCSKWKVGEIYEFDKWQVVKMDCDLINSRFSDWFLNEQQYRDYIINKIINE